MTGSRLAWAHVIDESASSRRLTARRAQLIERCVGLTAADERAFEQLWRRLGLSVDWSITYRTIDDTARTASQRAFLRNLARGEAYSALRPTLWDVTFRTAVAQAPGSPSTARTAAARSTSTRPVRSCCPPAWPSSRTRRTTATGRASVRRAKSQSKVSMRAGVRSLRVRGPAASVDRLRLVARDLRAAGHVQELTFDIDDPAAEVNTQATLRTGAPAGPAPRRP